MVAFSTLVLAAGMAAAAAAGRRFKYTIDFVACTDIHCQDEAISEQFAPWKYVKDGECKSYHDHSFPAWQYKWDGQPNGRACPECPDSFGWCTIEIYEKPECRGVLYNRLVWANLKWQNEWSRGYHVGENGERAQSVRVICAGDWQD